MTRFLFDTAVFVYARGREHAYRDPCRRLIELSQQGLVSGEASVGLVQEFAHIMRCRGISGTEVREQAHAVAALCLMHDLEEQDVSLALSLVATTSGLGVRDAVHAATAIRRGIPLIISPDQAFDGVTGLDRVDPHDAVQRLAPGAPEPREPV